MFYKNSALAQLAALHLHFHCFPFRASHPLAQNSHSAPPLHTRNLYKEEIMQPFQPEKEDLEEAEVRRGPWTLEEDNLLIQYITCHGEGRWNLLAKSAGLKRTGKSCRLRWLNYLKPDIKRGNLTPQEQLMILELHSKWGNRWSKIAQHLPGRTDNEIKNYWRTRVQKQARQLNMESNSQSFIDVIRCFYMPRLVQKMEQNSSSSTIMGYQVSGASSSPMEATMGLPFEPAQGGFDHIDQSHKDLFECSGYPSNPSSGYTYEDVTQCRDSSALPSDNWYYVGNSNYDMSELPSMSAVGQCSDAHMADHSWISSDVADDTWNLDGLW